MTQLLSPFFGWGHWGTGKLICSRYITTKKWSQCLNGGSQTPEHRTLHHCGLLSWTHDYLKITDVKTEAQQGEVIWPSHVARKMAEPKPDPRSLWLQSVRTFAEEQFPPAAWCYIQCHICNIEWLVVPLKWFSVLWFISSPFTDEFNRAEITCQEHRALRVGVWVLIFPSWLASSLENSSTLLFAKSFSSLTSQLKCHLFRVALLPSKLAQYSHFGDFLDHPLLFFPSV